MITAILIEEDASTLDALAQRTDQCCPQITILGKGCTISTGKDLIIRYHPSLVFLAQKFTALLHLFHPTNESQHHHFETIILTNCDQIDTSILGYNICGYLKRPIQPVALQLTVYNAERLIYAKKEIHRHKQFTATLLAQLNKSKLIGFPSMKGFDFFPVDDIIRCQGQNRCTIIYIKDRSKIISSYNLGEFRKLLQPFGFFSPHRSHLVNLRHIKKYNREGTITMIDGTPIPVANKKKGIFLNAITHL
jgi:two-component system LytT family response regulator